MGRGPRDQPDGKHSPADRPRSEGPDTSHHIGHAEQQGERQHGLGQPGGRPAPAW